MLPLIVQHSEALTSFIFALQLALYQPQIRHRLQIVDALIVCNQRKTLSDLSRLLHRSVDPKALADFFRESPRTVDLIGKPRKKFMLSKMLELARAAGIALKILVSLDDSLGKKGKATKHLPSLAECKRLHQQAHLDSLLCRLVTEIKKQPQRVQTILQAYLPVYAAGT